MAVLSDAKTKSAGYNEEEKWVSVTYDFSNDTGAVADYDVLTAGEDIVITEFYATVPTAVTSGGSAVMDLGVTAGGTNFWSDKAVADLSLNSFHAMDTHTPVKVASGAKVVFGIEAAALTAGVIKFNFKYKRL